MRFHLRAILAVLGSTICLARPASAEVGELTIAKQFGLLYQQITTMEDQKLIEKHAKALGLADLKVSFRQLASTGAMTDALLSGSLHIASGGVPGFLLLWDRTKGQMTGIGALAAYDQLMVTTRPDLKSVTDLGEKDKIAMPVVKVSPQAIFLQMAAAKALGDANFAKYDSLTISRAHPDSLAALLSRSEVTAHFSGPPFQQVALQQPGVTKVLSSYQIMGKNTPTMIYTTAKFASDNPKATEAVARALIEATEIIKRDLKASAELYVKLNGGKDSVNLIEAILKAPETDVTYKPIGVMKYAEHMHKTGAIKTLPKSIDDLFLALPELKGGS